MSDVSVVIVTYNHRDDISPCLRTCLENDPREIIVVDNGSTDGTVASVTEEFPSVTVIEADENSGYGGGVNLGADHASGEYLIVLNPDTQVTPDSFDSLIKPLQSGEADVTVPRMLLPGGDTINTIGNRDHFTGLSFVNRHGHPADSPVDFDCSGLSGACFAVVRETFDRIGGFDESIFLYMEDVELSWRVQYYDLDVAYVHDAVVYHDYALEVSPEKLYRLEFGRYYILRKYWSARSVAWFLPSLLMAEVLALGYAATHGLDGVRSKINAFTDAMQEDVDSSPPDGVLSRMDTTVPHNQLERNALDRVVVSAANLVFRYNMRLSEAMGYTTMPTLDIVADSGEQERKEKERRNVDSTVESGD